MVEHPLPILQRRRTGRERVSHGKILPCIAEHGAGEMTARMTPEVAKEFTRVTDYTPDEDRFIINAMHENRGHHVTVAQWKALALRLNRPASWLRYRWAVLVRKEEKAQAVHAAVIHALYSAPAQASIYLDMLSLVETLIEGVCDTQQQFPATIGNQVQALPPVHASTAVQSYVESLLHEVPAPVSVSIFSSVQAASIIARMDESQIVRDDLWNSLPRWRLTENEAEVLSSAWATGQKCAYLVDHERTLQMIHLKDYIDAQLQQQADWLWKSLADELNLPLKRAQETWSQTWFSVHYPGLATTRAGKRTCNQTPVFSPDDDATLVRRMRARVCEVTLPCWLPDLAAFLSKPVDLVAARWLLLSTPLLLEDQALLSASAFDRCCDEKPDSDSEIYDVDHTAQHTPDLFANKVSAFLHLYQGNFVF